MTAGWPARRSASWPCRKAKTASTANAACPAAYRPELIPSQLPWMLMTANEPRDRRLYYANNKQEHSTTNAAQQHSEARARAGTAQRRPKAARTPTMHSPTQGEEGGQLESFEVEGHEA